MRISDWSSDVCASDLNGVFISTYPVELFSSITEESNGCGALRGIVYDEARFLESIGQNLNSAIRKMGRESCRESECQYVYISLVAVTLNNKHHEHIDIAGSTLRNKNNFIYEQK